jgi:hypothetical protein
MITPRVIPASPVHLRERRACKLCGLSVHMLERDGAIVYEAHRPTGHDGTTVPRCAPYCAASGYTETQAVAWADLTDEERTTALWSPWRSATESIIELDARRARKARNAG